jgi:hypothetical protein
MVAFSSASWPTVNHLDLITDTFCGAERASDVYDYPLFDFKTQLQRDYAELKDIAVWFENSGGELGNLSIQRTRRRCIL